MGRIFGTDGVRGIANEKLDVELALAISRAAGMIIKKETEGKPKVIVTGGYTQLMKKFIIHKIDKIDSDLVFKGIGLLAELRLKKT